MRYDVAFLNLKSDEIQFLYYKIAFFTHVYTSWAVILIGFFQFWKLIRFRYPNLHRLFGKLYIFIILIFSAPSGLVMSFVANGGIWAQISFVVLSILWIFFTYKSYQFARSKNWKKHEEYILRSYALTLSAVSLRLFKMIIANVFDLPPMDTYRFVAWLGWIFNLCIVELYIRRKANR